MTSEPPFATHQITLEDLTSDVPLLGISAPVAKHRLNGHDFFNFDVDQGLATSSEVYLARIVMKSTARIYGKMIFAEGDFWVFADTMWRRVPETLVRRIIHKFDGAQIGAAATPLKVNSRTVSGVVRETITMASEPDYFSEPALGLNAYNCVVLIDESGAITTREHTPDDRHRFTIAADYRPGSELFLPPESMLYKLLNGAFQGDDDAKDKINLVCELLGAAAYGLATRLPQPKAFIFLGESASNGKSTIASLISILLPPGAVSSIPLSAFGDENRIVNLAGKAANVANELSAQSVAGEQFKAAVTGDPIEARDLYKSAMTFRPRALHICTTNVLPTFNGGLDRGLQRRLMVLPFFRTIPDKEIIPDIADRIRRDELHLLVGLAVRGAQRLVKQRGYTIPKSSQEAFAEWLLEEPVYAWFSERCVVEEQAEPRWITIDGMFEDFKRWSGEQGIPDKYMPSKKNFSGRLGRIKGVQKRRMSYGAEAAGAYLKQRPIVH